MRALVEFPGTQMRNYSRYLFVAALLLGFLQAWSQRFQVGVDIISYLDMGAAYMRGDWPAAINRLWPPLYAWLLGVVMKLVNPSMYWEYPLVQAVNFVVFALTTIAFRFFLTEFQLYRTVKYAGGCKTDGDRSLKGTHVAIIGYAFFIWSSIDLIEVSTTTPDMFVAGIVYSVSGLLIKIARGKGSVRNSVFIGAGLGIGYLAKAAMFPLAFVFLVVMTRITPKGQKSLVAFAAIVFATIAVPYSSLLTISKRSLTFSDQGLYVYACKVNGARYTVHWQGENPGNGTPRHPTRKIFDKPEAYEFATPIRATYPPFYDVMYWYDGLKPYFNLKQECRAIARNLKEIGKMFLFGLDGVFPALLCYFPLKSSRTGIFKDLLRYWFLIIPGAAAIGMYSLVYVEPRYLGAFMVVIGFVLVCGSAVETPFANAISILVLAMSLVVTFNESSETVLDWIRGSFSSKNEPWEVATALRAMGLREGDFVASANFSQMDIARWAHLAKVRIVAEVPTYPGDSAGFWAAGHEKRRKIVDLFEQTGAVLLITNEKPRNPDTTEWIELNVQCKAGLYQPAYYIHPYSALRRRRKNSISNQVIPSVTTK